MARSDTEMREFKEWLGARHVGAPLWYVDPKGGAVFEARYKGSAEGMGTDPGWLGIMVDVELLNGLHSGPVPIETLYATEEEAFAAAPTVIP
jgi:hypothetical protein